MEATLMWLQGDPIAGFVDETGAAVLDPVTGFPIPDPLMPLGDFITDPEECNPVVNGCIAVLEFVIRRVTVKLDH